MRGGYGVKADEATYVAMTMSLVHDGNLSYERRDLERFWGLYRQGPEGIFLKKGKRLSIEFNGTPPFVHLDNSTAEARTDRLYYGKAIVYPVAAAPFVWVFGMNGFLVMHVVLLALACACGYWFLAAQSRPIVALTLSLAFVGASIVPVYVVFLMPEILNLSLVFVAYFLWLYKEVAPRPGSLRASKWSDVAAVVLIAIVTYSKPTNLPLVIPMLMLWAWRRQFVKTLALSTVFAGATTVCFFGNALVTGEFNYQGGDRATFYGSFPFDGRQPDAWDRRESKATDSVGFADILDPAELPSRLGNNVKYFLIGRHFGLVPYFFPAIVTIAAWLLSRERLVAWRVLVMLGFAGSALGLLLFSPYTWSGGGGPPGNRYFLSAYPLALFLTPPLTWVGPGLVAWIGGALFTAKVLINPFVAAKFTWQIAERGFARRLPVELTMANDLPLMLDPARRGHIPYGHNPEVLLYFLDSHAYPPEPPGMWIAGTGRAEIIVRSDNPLDHVVIEAESPIRTVLDVSMGGETERLEILPGKIATARVAASGVRSLQSYAYLLTARSRDGFIPRLLNPASDDPRNLGVLVRLQAVERTSSDESGSR